VYRLYFLCAHDRSLVETPIIIKQSKAWVKKAAPFLKFAVFSIRMLVAICGVPIPSLPDFIPGNDAKEQFKAVVEDVEALLEDAVPGALDNIRSWIDECQDADDLQTFARGTEEHQLSPEAFGAVALEAYKPKNRGWMQEMEIANKGNIFGWVKKENVQAWKLSP
jgi:hypothetical protein